MKNIELVEINIRTKIWRKHKVEMILLICCIGPVVIGVVWAIGSLITDIEEKEVKGWGKK